MLEYPPIVVGQSMAQAICAVEQSPAAFVYGLQGEGRQEHAVLPKCRSERVQLEERNIEKVTRTPAVACVVVVNYRT